MFIKLTQIGGEPETINTDKIILYKPSGDRCEIVVDVNDVLLYETVEESYDYVDKMVRESIFCYTTDCYTTDTNGRPVTSWLRDYLNRDSTVVDDYHG